MTDITLEQRALEMAIEAAEHTGNPRVSIHLTRAKQILAALRLPAGADWVLVPREPTAHMVNRAHDATDPDCNATCGEIVEIYRAMLDAAPRHEPGESDD